MSLPANSTLGPIETTSGTTTTTANGNTTGTTRTTQRVLGSGTQIDTSNKPTYGGYDTAKQYQLATASNSAVVGMIYDNVLGRAPDAGGLDFWSSSGLSPLELQAAIRQGAIENGEVTTGSSNLFAQGFENMSLESLAGMINGIALPQETIDGIAGGAPGGAQAAQVNAEGLAQALQRDYLAAQERAQEWINDAIIQAQERTDLQSERAKREIEQQRRWQENEIQEWRDGVATADPAGIGELSPIESLNKMLESGSDYLDRAQTLAEQGMAQRGLNNSSLGVQAGVEGAIERATPLAISDAELANMRWESYEQNRATLANTHIQAGADQFARRLQFTFDSLLGINQAGLQSALDRGSKGMDAAIAAGQIRAQAAITNANNATQVSIVNAQLRMQSYLQDKAFLQQSSLIDRNQSWGFVNDYMKHQYAKDIQFTGFLQELGVIDAQYAANLTLQNNALATERYTAELSAFTNLAIEQARITSNEGIAQGNWINNLDVVALTAESDRILENLRQEGRLELADLNYLNTFSLEKFRADRAFDLQRDAQAFSSSEAGKDRAAAYTNLMAELNTRVEIATMQVDSANRSSYANLATSAVEAYSDLAISVMNNPEYVGNTSAINTALQNGQATILEPILEIANLTYGGTLSFNLDVDALLEQTSALNNNGSTNPYISVGNYYQGP